MTRLSEITAEQVCAKRFSLSWDDLSSGLKTSLLHEAENYLDAIRALVAGDEVQP